MGEGEDLEIGSWESDHRVKQLLYPCEAALRVCQGCDGMKRAGIKWEGCGSGRERVGRDEGVILHGMSVALEG